MLTEHAASVAEAATPPQRGGILRLSGVQMWQGCFGRDAAGQAAIATDENEPGALRRTCSSCSVFFLVRRVACLPTCKPDRALARHVIRLHLRDAPVKASEMRASAHPAAGREGELLVPRHAPQRSPTRLRRATRLPATASLQHPPWRERSRWLDTNRDARVRYPV